jgi:putative ABC transport system permease protein
MLKNYLSIALRFMVKQTGFTVINIFGLTIGLACSLVMLLYIQDELAYDRFHVDSDRIYRLVFGGKLQGKQLRSTQTGSPLAAALCNDIPEVESVIRLACWKTFPVGYDSTTFTEDYLLLSDSNFFSFFDFDLIIGNKDSVLIGPRNIVISESAAKRYFNYRGAGDTGPIGKTLTLAQGYQATVSGVVRDAPANSHFHFSLILSLPSWTELRTTGWIEGKVITYFKLKKNISIEGIATKINSQLTKNVGKELWDLRQITLDQFETQGNKLEYLIQPLHTIHLRSDLEGEIETNGSIQNVYFFAAIAIFIGLLASINFINLSTSRSVNRAKEVGVRKTAGANRYAIVRQFLVESFLYLFIALIFAFLLMLLILTPFNYFTEKHLTFYSLLRPAFVFPALGITLLIGLLAGSYPAFYLAKYNPIEVFKGKLRGRLRKYGVRNLLVIFQFSISAGLIFATLVVYQQVRYIQQADLGFDKENVVNLLHTKNLDDNAEIFKAEILAHAGVVGASYCNRLPPNMDWQAIFKPAESEKDFLLTVYEMDFDHPKTMGYKMTKGRFFSREVKADTLAIVINETAARKLGLEDFEGKKIMTGSGTDAMLARGVIGIMKDFHFMTLKEPIQPLAIFLGKPPNMEMAIRISPDNTEATLALIEKSWKKYSFNAPFEYTFLDKNFESKNQSEKLLTELIIFFTLLALLIACLGLFGLATFTVEQRTKEIGIRKALGASAANIGAVLNRDFLRLVLIANVLALPISAWVMNKWLEQFAYQVNLKAMFFLLSVAITFIIALASVSYHVVKTAQINPVDSLRSE